MNTPTPTRQDSPVAADELARFEEAMRDKDFAMRCNDPFIRDRDGFYIFEKTALAFMGWQAALASRAPVQQPAGEPVAWRHRQLRDSYGETAITNWEFIASKPLWPHENEQWECEPLYTAPHSAAAQGWLPIESAPKDGTRVLVWKYGYTITCAEFVNGKWYSSDLQSLRAARTHWMPLPAEPQRTAPQPASAPTGEEGK